VLNLKKHRDSFTNLDEGSHHRKAATIIGKGKKRWCTDIHALDGSRTRYPCVPVALELRPSKFGVGQFLTCPNNLLLPPHAVIGGSHPSRCMCLIFIVTTEALLWAYCPYRVSPSCQKALYYIRSGKYFRTESITKYAPATINTRWEATQRDMAAKLTRLAHKIAIQLHLMAVLAPGGQSGNFWVHPHIALSWRCSPIRVLFIVDVS
jgi:hypothetical protein